MFSKFNYSIGSGVLAILFLVIHHFTLCAQTPTPPTATSASSVLENGFTANWTGVSNATSFEIDVSTDNFATVVPGYNAATTSGTSLDVTGLTGCTDYQFRVRGVNVDGTSTDSNVVLVTTSVTTPGTVAASAMSQTGFTANWNSIPCATGYYLDVATDSGFGFILSLYDNLLVSGTSQSVTGLSAGTTYYYQLRATNASGSSSNSNIISTITLPADPTATAASSITQTSFTSNWNSVTGASGYDLDVATDLGFTSIISSGTNLSSTSQSVTGLSAGTTYYYQLRATNASGTSSNSNIISTITLPADPTATAASSITQTGFTSNWNSVTGASGYDLDVATDLGFTSIISSSTDLSSTSQSVTGLSAGTTYYYQLRATNASGTSSNSNIISTITLPADPTATAASSIAQSSFTANWNSVTGATNYDLDVATDSGFGSIIGSYTNILLTSKSITGLSAGTTYYYRARSLNSSGTSSNSNTISTITISGDPTATGASSITQSSFTANWNSVTGATDYDLDVATDSGFGSIIGSYTNILLTSKSITGLSAGTTYYYRVRSLNSSGASSNSNAISTITIPADPTTTAASSITQSSFTANWNSVTGATNYDLDVATDSGFGSIIGSYPNILLTSKSITGLSAGTTYYYRVRSTNASGASSNSNATSTITIPSDPTATSASSITQSSFTANWNSVTGATDYDLDVATDSGFGSIIVSYPNILLTSKNIIGLSAGTTYYYRVRSLNESGTSSNSNVISTITVPVDPTATAASSITQSSFIANWNSVTGATDYDLDVATDSGFGSIIGSYTNISSTSKNITGLSAGTTYFYRVRSTNAGGTSFNSNTISTITVPADPTATAANYTTQSTFTAGWNSVTGATSYDLVVATDVTFTTILSTYNNLSVSGITQSVTGLTAGTTYYYRLRSVNTSGASSYSNIISVITIPGDPIATTASSATQNSFMANWNSVTGASGYRLDVSTNSGFTAILPLYNNLSVSGTTQSVTGLSAGTTYYYRLRALNTSGTSSNSNTISLITIPVNPTAIAASSITQNGFTANWNSVTGAGGYYLDVSADSFASVLSSYNNVAVVGTSQNVIGLTAGTTYYYRVRSTNASGTSSSSNTISIITVPTNPTATAANSITQNSFTANWNSVTGASGYKLDVATDGSFVNILSSYTALSVSGTSQSVTGLSSATTYYYRVRSTNAGGTSLNSNIISMITISAGPTATAASSITQSGFTANWNSVAGASGYYLDVATDASLINILSSYNNLSVSGASQSVAGLSAGITYYYRVRSANVSGTSTNSNVISTITIPADAIAIGASSITQNSFTANWNSVTGASGYNLDVATDALFASILSSYNNLSVSGTSQSVTGLAAETNYYYRIRSKNTSGMSSSSNVITLQTSPAPATEAIPTLSSGGTLQSYTMFSIPLALQNNDSTIATLFSALGAYTPDKWRLLRWNSTASNWDEYQKGISTIDRGKSYWFNSVSPASVSVTGTSFTKSSFALQLKPGWNQIGSPYNFDVSWADVIAKNASVAGVSLVETSLYKYVSSSASFAQTDNLKAWGGGFVFNGGSAITLKIPITVTHAIGGRVSSDQTIFSNTGDWFLPLKLSVNEVENNYSGIGMHTDAVSSYDQFDGITVPRFVKYLELNSYHADFFEPYFARDVVTTAKSYNWHLVAESNLDNENALLTWDSHSLGNSETQLILFDPATGSIVDMKQNSQYNFRIQGKHPLHFFYAVDKESFKPDITSLASVYPNPVSTTVTFPVFVANSSERVQIEIYNNLGKVVKLIGNGIYDSGLHMEQWDCTDNQGSRVSSGMYIYRFVGENNLIQTGKLIVN